MILFIFLPLSFCLFLRIKMNYFFWKWLTQNIKHESYYRWYSFNWMHLHFFDGVINCIGIFQQCFPLFWWQWDAFFARFHFAILFVKLTVNGMRSNGEKKNHHQKFIGICYTEFCCCWNWYISDNIKCEKKTMAYRMSM